MHACYRTIIATILMLALQLVVLSSWAFAQRPLDVPGATGTIALGSTDAGTIVGGYVDTSGTNHGFLWQGGTFLLPSPLDVPVPGATATRAYGINTTGVVVGTYVDSSNRVQGFVLQQ